MLCQKIDITKNATPPQKNEPVEITRLINSIFFFIEVVFIIQEKRGYRLVALHHGSVWTDTIYPTLRGAKIAFSKFYQEKAWKDGVKPEWTPPYIPYGSWLKQQMKNLEKSH